MIKKQTTPAPTGNTAGRVRKAAEVPKQLSNSVSQQPKTVQRPTSVAVNPNAKRVSGGVKTKRVK